MATKTKIKGATTVGVVGARSDVTTLGTLANIREAANLLATGEATLAASIKACPETMDVVKREVYVGRVSASLDVTYAVANSILAKKVFKDGADDQRTQEEERAYTAARVWFTSFVRRYGFVATTSPSPSKDDVNEETMSTDKLVMPGKPKVHNAVELVAWCEAYAKSGYDFFLLNKAHPALATPHGEKLMGAFADFLADVQEILNETWI